eukprot:scaffold5237_cov116-Isochrysis_galbana.AAC.3
MLGHGEADIMRAHSLSSEFLLTQTVGTCCYCTSGLGIRLPWRGCFRAFALRSLFRSAQMPRPMPVPHRRAPVDALAELPARLLALHGAYCLVVLAKLAACIFIATNSLADTTREVAGAEAHAGRNLG